jgi:hypothetical protein
MQKIAAGHEIGQALCEALGLPKHTRSFDSRCAVDKALTVRSEYFPQGLRETSHNRAAYSSKAARIRCCIWRRQGGENLPRF